MDRKRSDDRVLTFSFIDRNGAMDFIQFSDDIAHDDQKIIDPMLRQWTITVPQSDLTGTECVSISERSDYQGRATFTLTKQEHRDGQLRRRLARSKKSMLREWSNRDGGSVRDLIQIKPMSDREIVTVITQVLRGLNFLHRNSVNANVEDGKEKSLCHFSPSIPHSQISKPHSISTTKKHNRN
jgi:hypothetical protein